MNYIRGAVNAISAPYQYYKDLPPINASTLTGAIDVIVIERPTDNGGTELVCSPFHVRFGKWQVLRPSEKKVNLFVNGSPIPFNMKIGEAGEAFFVFETEDDIPESLITSPILQPTVLSPEEEEKKEEPVDTDRFGAEQDDQQKAEQVVKSEDERIRVEPDFLDLDGGSRDEDHNEDVRTTPKQTYPVPKFIRKSGSRATISQSSALSPALSLPSPPPSREHSIERSHTPEMNEQDQRADAALKALKAEAHVPEVEYHHDITLDFEGYKLGYHDRERSDQAVRSSFSAKQTSDDQFELPRKRRPSSPPSPPLPQKPPSAHLAHTQSALHSPYASSPSPSSSPSSSPSPSPSTSPSTSHAPQFPFRATSEPPPDIDVQDDAGPVLTIPAQSHLHQPHVQEYSWEWGAFPQPSPMKASFGKGGRLESPAPVWGPGAPPRKSRTLSDRKGRLSGMALPPAVTKSAKLEEWKEENAQAQSQGAVTGRSRSVPPSLEGSPARKGRRGSREYKEYEDFEDEEEQEERSRPWSDVKQEEEQVQAPQEDWTFGFGGILSASRDDPTLLVLTIEGKKVGFHLSLFQSEDEEEEKEEQRRGRIGKGKAIGQRREDEVEAARLFDRYRVDLSRLLDDESVVEDPRLVIRWAGDQYVTRNDGSPLMDALKHWRSSTLKKRESGDALRPVSPPPPVDSQLTEQQQLEQQEQELLETPEHKGHERSKSEPPSASETRQMEEDKADSGKEGAGLGKTESQPTGPAKKPTSSSWVQWWSRSRRDDDAASVKGYSPLDPKKDNSALSLPLPARPKPFLEEKQKSASVDLVKPLSEPSTPVQHPIEGGPVPPLDTTIIRPSSAVAPPAPVKKFAKTLRLTSDQLKSLNLRPGPNAITFSLSASGVVAATARIFVWDSKDLVVVSDIDGTITKSDGLGHVFAMIGRDWTHVGVAKLYTDIAKNGYKIMYLTSRAIGQADATRDYLKGIKQNNYQLPEGPVIMSPDRLMASLHREVIMRKPEVFKMACLRDIQRLFGESARNPFYAGFGNRITDALSYRTVSVPSARIFTIDSAGEVKMELLELAGYKSSYIHMTDLVDQMFPPIHRKWTPEFTDFNYWKTPVADFPLPDLSPPSPALSARSDTSNQSPLARLRNFSLGGNNVNRQNVTKQPSIASIADEKEGSDADAYRSSHLRHMSSFEKLSSTLGFVSRISNGDSYQRSASPESSSSYLDSDDEDGEEELDADGKRRRRLRRRSMTSMPGTLDERHFGMDDEEEDQEHHDDDDQHFGHGEEDEGENGYDGEGDEIDGAEQEAEEAFDDDLLAAGEMQNVPFL